MATPKKGKEASSMHVQSGSPPPNVGILDMLIPRHRKFKAAPNPRHAAAKAKIKAMAPAKGEKVEKESGTPSVAALLLASAAFAATVAATIFTANKLAEALRKRRGESKEDEGEPGESEGEAEERQQPKEREQRRTQQRPARQEAARQGPAPSMSTGAKEEHRPSTIQAPPPKQQHQHQQQLPPTPLSPSHAHATESPALAPTASAAPAPPPSSPETGRPHQQQPQQPPQQAEAGGKREERRKQRGKGEPTGQQETWVVVGEGGGPKRRGRSAEEGGGGSQSPPMQRLEPLEEEIPMSVEAHKRRLHTNVQQAILETRKPRAEPRVQIKPSEAAPRSMSRSFADVVRK